MRGRSPALGSRLGAGVRGGSRRRRSSREEALWAKGSERRFKAETGFHGKRLSGRRGFRVRPRRSHGSRGGELAPRWKASRPSRIGGSSNDFALTDFGDPSSAPGSNRLCRAPPSRAARRSRANDRHGPLRARFAREVLAAPPPRPPKNLVVPERA